MRGFATAEPGFRWTVIERCRGRGRRRRWRWTVRSTYTGHQILRTRKQVYKKRLSGRGTSFAEVDNGMDKTVYRLLRSWAVLLSVGTAELSAPYSTVKDLFKTTRSHLARMIVLRRNLHSEWGHAQQNTFSISLLSIAALSSACSRHKVAAAPAPTTTSANRAAIDAADRENAKLHADEDANNDREAAANRSKSQAGDQAAITAPVVASSSIVLN